MTLHIKSDIDTMIFQIMKIHEEAPEVVFYLENESCFKHGPLIPTLFQTVTLLNKMDIEAYMLLDTCHIEMDKYAAVMPDLSYKTIFQSCSSVLQAVHFSLSQKHEGFILEQHGRGYSKKDGYTKKDEKFIKNTIKALKEIAESCDKDIYLIAEVQEKEFGSKCKRKNGKQMVKYLEQILN